MESFEYLAVYQQYFDEEKRIECFVLRTGVKEEEIHNTEPVIIVSSEKIHQIIKQFSKDYADGSYRSDQVMLQDINFDKKKDIILDAGSIGNQEAAISYAWCWNDNLQEYVYFPSFRNIMNSSIDYLNGCIRGSWRNSASSHSWQNIIIWMESC